jgi:hypothetical protein
MNIISILAKSAKLSDIIHFIYHSIMIAVLSVLIYAVQSIQFIALSCFIYLAANAFKQENTDMDLFKSDRDTDSRQKKH